ncbi:CPBP family intramembrane metalloprotease [Capnocytophaga genosp. AHN8471]|uniref:CPBP family intramembrane metalloprotease n=1 Tax=Capnocytophaga genosp. AHN8471 TaxID=327574 RepID=A0ABS1YSU8_9FLAO|nr:CPBP family glutamic-type intramembrane protease [Capnocytophaga genosp. AHN8471]MBM0649479.1 CPBP family intramembrane metalloprotease [Capnocytophaga genosp. AHN8471]MBM0661175.1 CPBP family intramembrane metalloprotease [Capnocytophaga genosp. AHN8471]
MRTNKKTLRNVILFSLVAISCGWIGVRVNQLLGEPSNLESLGSGIFIASPIVCMILLRLLGGDGWKDFPLKPRFKQNTRWYIFAIAVYPVVIGITLFVGKLLGWVDVSKFSVATYLPVFATAFLPIFIKNILEETAFRGYLTVKMEQLTKNEWVIYVVVAFVCQIWHLPYNLIFLDDAYQATFFPYSKVLFVFVSFVVIAVWTIMYTEIFFLSRSLLLVVLMHSMKDALNPLISEGFTVISPDKTLLVSPLFGLIPTLIYLVIGLYLRRIRKSKECLHS